MQRYVEYILEDISQLCVLDTTSISSLFQLNRPKCLSLFFVSLKLLLLLHSKCTEQNFTSVEILVHWLNIMKL